MQRRKLLGLGLAAGASTLLGCAVGPLRTTPHQGYLRLPYAAEPGRVLLAFPRDADFRDAVETLVPQISDMSWLGKGDSVFVKVACNSTNVHPAVTHPKAVRAMVRFLKSRGAGTVYVGDQAGVEHVRATPAQRKSSTRATMAKNGLLAAIEGSGATPWFFDEQPWDDAFEPEHDFADSWGGAIRLPSILRRVDHVVYLPRLGAHAVAGYTAGIKAAVGWLRDDSRCALHRDGDRFFERIAEINHFRPLRDKLRLAFTLGDAALLNVGPDFGAVYRFEGLAAVGSTRLVDHDLLVAALLPWLDAHEHSIFDVYAPYPTHVNYWNRGFVEETWGKADAAAYRPIVAPRFERGLEYDVQTAHLATLQGYRPRKVQVVGPREGRPADLAWHLAGYGGGIFAVG
jgi:uncharacterized protein (DUF362 family)